VSSCSEPPSRTRGSGDEGAVPVYAAAKRVNLKVYYRKRNIAYTHSALRHPTEALPSS
jgi:hypothetical protein